MEIINQTLDHRFVPVFSQNLVLNLTCWCIGQTEMCRNMEFQYVARIQHRILKPLWVICILKARYNWYLHFYIALAWLPFSTTMQRTIIAFPRYLCLVLLLEPGTCFSSWYLSFVIQGVPLIFPLKVQKVNSGKVMCILDDLHLRRFTLI